MITDNFANFSIKMLTISALVRCFIENVPTTYVFYAELTKRFNLIQCFFI